MILRVDWFLSFPRLRSVRFCCYSSSDRRCRWQEIMVTIHKGTVSQWVWEVRGGGVGSTKCHWKNISRCLQGFYFHHHHHHHHHHHRQLWLHYMTTWLPFYFLLPGAHLPTIQQQGGPILLASLKQFARWNPTWQSCLKHCSGDLTVSCREYTGWAPTSYK